jgi:hypothetical protein
MVFQRLDWTQTPRGLHVLAKLNDVPWYVQIIEWTEPGYAYVEAYWDKYPNGLRCSIGVEKMECIISPEEFERAHALDFPSFDLVRL